MKKIFNVVKKLIIFYTFIYFLILMLLKLILNTFNMEFVFWVYEYSYYLINVGIVLGIIQLFFKLKISKVLKICLSILFFMIYSFVVGILTFMLLFTSLIPDESSFEYNDKKYIIQNKGVWLHGTLTYYEYINFMVRSNEIMYEESY